MFRRSLILLAGVFALWAALSWAIGIWILPDLLLAPPLPARTESQRAAIRSRICTPGSRWEHQVLPGGGGHPIDLWHLRRPNPKGVVLILHGFADDAWGSASWAESVPHLDAVVFTFRGRDRNPSVPCTLGAWEKLDVVEAVHYLEAAGWPRARILILASSMGSGIALQALAELEVQGHPLGGALLECPFRDLEEAGRNHLKGALGPVEPLTRVAQAFAIGAAGRKAGFDPERVSPLLASRNLRTPVALLTGDSDPVTPLEGVRTIADFHPDLTVVRGAGHCEAAKMIPGGWNAWAAPRLERWGFADVEQR